jgi:DNA adenine methylase
MKPESLTRKSTNGFPKPILKWAGGKGQLIDELLPRIPKSFKSYHEPFCGGAALFFALHRLGLLKGKRCHLSDINDELITTYKAIKDDVQAVTKILDSYQPTKTEYYRVRDMDPKDPAKIAARMIFLNKTGFNGLFRVNSKGKFNVPFGKHKDPRFFDPENLVRVSDALKHVELRCQQFTEVLKQARQGDFVYFDPPYDPVSRTAYFVGYAKGGCGRPYQAMLHETCLMLDESGVQVMESNSSTDWVQKRYEGLEHFVLTPVLAHRNINSRGDKRGPVQELIITNYQPGGG